MVIILFVVLFVVFGVMLILKVSIFGVVVFVLICGIMI